MSEDQKVLILAGSYVIAANTAQSMGLSKRDWLYPNPDNMRGTTNFRVVLGGLYWHHMNLAEVLAILRHIEAAYPECDLSALDSM